MQLIRTTVLTKEKLVNIDHFLKMIYEISKALNMINTIPKNLAYLYLFLTTKPIEKSTKSTIVAKLRA